MWYLIVSIPDLCTITYFYWYVNSDEPSAWLKGLQSKVSCLRLTLLAYFVYSSSKDSKETTRLCRLICALADAPKSHVLSGGL